MPPSKTAVNTGSISSSGKLIVDFINVGQGNAVLVTFPNGNHLLVDCGSQNTSTSGTAFKHAQQYITAVTGGTDIYSIVITHPDDDHAIFLPYIKEAQNPRYLMYGGKRSDFNPKVLNWIDGLDKGKNRTSVYFYKKDYFNINPDSEYGSPTFKGSPHVITLAANYQGGSSNSNSVVLLILHGSQGIVLTGDADWNTENFILEKIPKYLLKKCTLYLPGHHGSFYSTSQAFLDALGPDLSAVSASATNMSYAHPDCETMDMLTKKASKNSENHGIACSEGRSEPYTGSNTQAATFLTGTNGDIRYLTDGENLQVKISSWGTFSMLPGRVRKKAAVIEERYA